MDRIPSGNLHRRRRGETIRSPPLRHLSVSRLLCSKETPVGILTSQSTQQASWVALPGDSGVRRRPGKPSQQPSSRALPPPPASTAAAAGLAPNWWRVVLAGGGAADFPSWRLAGAGCTGRCGDVRRPVARGPRSSRWRRGLTASRPAGRLPGVAVQRWFVPRLDGRIWCGSWPSTVCPAS